jgi:hypothetical protein
VVEQLQRGFLAFDDDVEAGVAVCGDRVDLVMGLECKFFVNFFKIK